MRFVSCHTNSMPMVLVTLLAVSTSYAGTDWATWRGPNQNGTVAAAGYFPTGGFGLEIAWKKTLGSGYSGMSVSDGKLVTMFTDGTSDLLAAFDMYTGDEVWRYRMGPMYEGHDGSHDGPVSTPIVGDGTVYALGADGRLVAVQLEDGRARWSLSLIRDFQAPTPFWGFATTPVVEGDVVVVQTGGSNGRALVAFNKRTGEVRWASGTGRVDYRSPVLTTLRGRRQLLVPTDETIRGVDPQTREKLWALPIASNSGATPLAVGADGILLQAPSGVVLMRLDADGRSATVAWRTGEFRGSYAAPVSYEGYVYGFTGRFLTCVDVRTGARKWRSRQPGGKGLIIVDGHLVVLGSNGDVVVAEASPSGYREKARLNVSDADGYTWPVFANGMIFVRNLEHLAAIRVTTAPSPTEVP